MAASKAKRPGTHTSKPKLESGKAKGRPAPAPGRWRLPRLTPRTLVGLVIVVTLLVLFLPGVLRSIFPGFRPIAALFTREVQRWDTAIARWAGEHGLDPNLVATIMQIESCGHPEVTSSAGAQGLFQVMPMHFTPEEQSRMTEPDLNAQRGMGVLLDCLRWANNDAGLALACYNGGPARISQPLLQWPAETQRYYQWGTGIYADARRGADQSASLRSWLEAGGWVLCQRASAALGLVTSTPLLFPVSAPTEVLPTIAPEQDGTPTGPPPGALPTIAPGQLVVPTASPPGQLPTFDAGGG